MTGGLHVTRDLLLLVLDKPPSLTELAKRTPAEIKAAEKWASYVHLTASDNKGLRRVDKPYWLRYYK